ncbi:MAG: hypothetical protein AAFX50_13105, partial [Acidobacteriota bacterium]
MLWGCLSTAALATDASATTSAVDDPCAGAQVVGLGDSEAAGVIAVDVDRPGLLLLSWEGGEPPTWLPCGDVETGDLGVKRIDSTPTTLRMAVEHPGTVHFNRRADAGSARLRVDLEAVEVRRDSFWLDLGRRRLAVEHTAYLR